MQNPTPKTSKQLKQPQKMMTETDLHFEDDPFPDGNICNFDQNAIYERYHMLQHSQYNHLKEANLSEALKQKLFGFQENTLFSNDYNPRRQLVIETHPIKGRIVMTKDKYTVLDNSKRREINIKSAAFNHDYDVSNQASRMRDLSDAIPSHMFLPEGEVMEMFEPQLKGQLNSNTRLANDTSF